ncbi:hypothetical protein ADK38_07505 [Streptomyces varsoviensis]|uniref:Uncharacterized protein n=1 Tax=Streptomyces varsoviensis TaxID=67373 RepID=A0ABR5JBE5_9ACTN|nr:hypothetical protein ADK38_07505 [Streptomyces varsoviensis]
MVRAACVRYDLGVAARRVREIREHLEGEPHQHRVGEAARLSVARRVHGRASPSRRPQGRPWFRTRPQGAASARISPPLRFFLPAVLRFVYEHPGSPPGRRAGRKKVRVSGAIVDQRSRGAHRQERLLLCRGRSLGGVACRSEAS